VDDRVEDRCLILTVGKFTAGIAKWFANRAQLQNIGIEGEISGLHEFGNGHLGFTLKDEQAIIECIAWWSNRQAFPAFENGDKAIAFGSVRIHPERGGYKLYVESIQLSGRGALLQLYEKLKDQFEREGLFGAERKRAVPALLQSIALVSARDGRGVSDFLRTIHDEVPFVDVHVIETRVQGEGAEIDIATALDRAARLGVEAIVLARGGGKYEELFTFNLEPVVRAIVRSTVPVITAIGHEPDRHLADAVADRVFDTPSKAAEFIAKNWLVARRRLTVAGRDLERSMRQAILRRAQQSALEREKLEHSFARILARKRNLLAETSAVLERRSPQRTLADARERLAGRSGRLHAAAAALVARKQRVWTSVLVQLDAAGNFATTRAERTLERLGAALERCDPLAPLARGYAIVTKDERVVRDAALLSPGDRIGARLQRGIVAARVESVGDA
jgi:exodeoxyribonuclease VII large subunit